MATAYYDMASGRKIHGFAGIRQSLLILHGMLLQTEVVMVEPRFRIGTTEDQRFPDLAPTYELGEFPCFSMAELGEYMRQFSEYVFSLSKLGLDAEARTYIRENLSRVVDYLVPKLIEGHLRFYKLRYGQSPEKNGAIVLLDLEIPEKPVFLYPAFGLEAYTDAGGFVPWKPDYDEAYEPEMEPRNRIERISKEPSEALTCSSELKMMTFGDCPSDVMVEILKALPAKSLLRFRCVCKDWRSVIDDPDFVNLHRIRSYHRRGGLKLLVGQIIYRFVDLEGNTLDSHTSLKQLCNYIHFDSGDRIDGYATQGVEGLLCDGYAVWNPTTRKRFHLKMRLSSVFRNTWALGFDSQATEYKVVRLLLYENPSSIQVLTLGTNAWRNIDLDLVPKEAREAGSIDCGVYAQNKIFFKTEKHNKLIGVLVFCVGEETFQFLPAPEEINRLSLWSLIESGNSIALMSEKGKEVWILCDVETQRWDYVSSSSELFKWRQIKVVCSIDSKEEALVMGHMGEGCCYWDMKRKTTRRGPVDLGHIHTKLVETLFDPTLVRMPRE